LTTFVAWQIGGLAQNWLVHTMTGSALTLGWVSGGWSLVTIVFSLVGGIAADRMDKRLLMVWVQAGLGIMPLAVATLAFLGDVPVWLLALHSLVLGLLFSFIMPARESYATQLVGRRAVLNAMALSTMGMALMGILSSTLGGALVDQLGATAAFLIVTVLYGITSVLFLQLPRSEASRPPSTGRQRVHGWHWVRYWATTLLVIV